MTDVVQSTYELAELMHKDAGFVEQTLLKSGDNLIAVYEDVGFKNTFQDLRNKKIEVLTKVIEDVAGGVSLLRSSSLGVSMGASKLALFVAPHGNPPSGTVLFSVSWKDVAAFKNWRNESGKEVSQGDINSALYALAHRWSQLMP